VIYKTTVKSDGTGLEIPTIAAELPSGESGGVLFGYLDFLFVSVSSGTHAWRLALPDAEGNLTLGARFMEDEGINYFNHLPGAVDRFALLTGGRADSFPTVYKADLSVINDALEPGWARDVRTAQIAGGGAYVVAAFANVLNTYFLVSDGTVHSTTSDYFTGFASVDMGELSFGMREPKVYVEATAEATDGTVAHQVSFLPPVAQATDATRAFNWRMTLTPTVSGDDMTVQYPVFRALPAPEPIYRVSLPLLLHDEIYTRAGGQVVSVDPGVELAYLRGLLSSGKLIDFQDGDFSATAQVIGVDFQPLDRDERGDNWQGVALVTLKVLP
jgi:hypothetical protein